MYTPNKDISRCPYCGEKTELKPDIDIYGVTYGGQVYVCRNYPTCDAYVGCHKGTDKPLGRLANKQLRAWKSRAHGKFDFIWQRKKMKRGQAYKWLAEQLDIPVDKCHIGMFDVDLCKRVVEVCSK
jgi:ssDNA-binding Zn-finger/Zn-ribbon topoisomerase 1